MIATRQAFSFVDLENIENIMITGGVETLCQEASSVANGAKVWCFPDGYLPLKNGGGPVEPHEALMLLNVGDRQANVMIDVYFEDKDPATDIPVTVDAQRVKSLRLDRPTDLGGLKIPPLTQYSIRIRSDTKIVAQFGRLDCTQANMAYYVGVGYCE